MKKDDLVLDEWRKELAPSAELRKRFNHDPERWVEFSRRYTGKIERSRQKGCSAEERAHAVQGMPTLVEAAKDEERNDPVVLKEVLEAKG